MMNAEVFYQALVDAGLAGLPFSWGSDGVLEFDDSITPEQRQAITELFHQFRQQR